MASKVVTTKTNLPILSNLLLKADSNNVTIEATNIDLSVRLVIPAKVEESGSVTVPARKFTEYLGTLQGEHCDVSIDKMQVVVSGDKDHARFVTMPTEDFPQLPDEESVKSRIVVGTSELTPVLKQVVFAAAQSEMNPVLSGVLFEPTESGQLTVVATDTFRLSVRTLGVGSPVEGSFIVPAAALVELSHYLGDSYFTESAQGEGVEVALSAQENQVFFRYGDVLIMARLLEADFPPYKKALLDDYSTVVSVSSADLLRAIKRTAIFASREAQAMRLNVNAQEGVLELSAQSMEVGSHVGRVEASIEGQSVELGFNSRYLAEGIESFAAQEIKIYIKGETSAVMFTSAQDQNYRHVIMPMVLHNNG